MERRVLLAIFLAFLVLYAWQALFVKPVPKPGAASTSPTSAAATTPGSEAGARTATPASASLPEPDSAATASAAAPPSATPLVADPAERDVRVETRDVIAVFTNRGARLKSWRLKRYRNQQSEPQELI